MDKAKVRIAFEDAYNEKSFHHQKTCQIRNASVRRGYPTAEALIEVPRRKEKGQWWAKGWFPVAKDAEIHGPYCDWEATIEVQGIGA